MNRDKVLPPFLFFIFLCFLFLLGNQFGLTKPLVFAGETAIRPVKEGLYRTGQGFGQIFSGLFSFNSSSKKIAGLESQLRDYSVLSAKVSLLEEENKALRKQLEAPLPGSMKFLPAKTLGLTRYLTIDKGESDGVKINSTVISENILVGRVVEITPKTARVLLPVDPDSKIAARALGTNARGLVTGEFGTKAFFDKVLQAETLNSGDLVVTTGEGGYTRDLLIGKIVKVAKNDVEPFQKAELNPLLDYGRLENVFVIE